MISVIGSIHSMSFDHDLHRLRHLMFCLVLCEKRLRYNQTGEGGQTKRNGINGTWAGCPPTPKATVGNLFMPEIL